MKAFVLPFVSRRVRHQFEDDAGIVASAMLCGSIEIARHVDDQASPAACAHPCSRPWRRSCRASCASIWFRPVSARRPCPALDWPLAPLERRGPVQIAGRVHQQCGFGQSSIGAIGLGAERIDRVEFVFVRAGATWRAGRRPPPQAARPAGSNSRGIVRKPSTPPILERGKKNRGEPGRPQCSGLGRDTPRMCANREDGDAEPPASQAVLL